MLCKGTVGAEELGVMTAGVGVECWPGADWGGIGANCSPAAAMQKEVRVPAMQKEVRVRWGAWLVGSRGRVRGSWLASSPSVVGR